MLRPTFGRRQWLVAAGGALAAAAAATLLLRPSPLVPMPTYGAELTATVSETRSDLQADPVRPLVLKRGTGQQLVGVLRPARAAPTGVELRAFLAPADGPLIPWEPAHDLSSDGAVRVVAQVDSLPPGLSGAARLVFAIGPPDRLPAAAEVPAALTASSPTPGDGRWSLLVVDVRVEPAP